MGQEDIPEITIDELVSPNFPAFTILDLNPSDIDRPTSTKPLAFSLANSLENKSLASDVAIEFSPYWFSSHPNLTFNKYFRNKIQKDSVVKDVMKIIGNNIMQTSSVSLATADFDNGIDSIDGRRMSLGLRFQILAGDPSPDYLKVYEKQNFSSHLWQIFDLLFEDNTEGDEIAGDIENKGEIYTAFEKKLGEYFSVIQIPGMDVDLIKTDLLEAGKSRIDNYPGDPENAVEVDSALAKIRDGIIKLQEGEVATLREDEGITSRVGWLWEIAAASSFQLPTNKIDYVIEEKWGMWSTLTYRTPNQKNDLSLMIRRMGEFKTLHNYDTDIGLSYVLNRKNYNVTFEGIYRRYKTEFEITATDGQVYTVEDEDNTMRFALSVQFRIADYLYLSGSVGKDFESPVYSSGSLFSLFNLGIILPENTTIPNI